MSYLETIGKKARKAFEDLKSIKHSKIKKVLETIINLYLKIKKELFKKIEKMLKMLKENIL
tara:strand:- start:467 stop:649 length:183 start_codon:yes stop_codon:yes gene_type:complete